MNPLRLFVALALPEDVRQTLIGWQASAVAGTDGLRAVAPESLHLTLCFLGSQHAGSVPEIAAALEAVSGEAAPAMSLAQPAWLPARRPRVLAIQLTDPTGQLQRVQAALAAVLGAGGWYEAQARRYRPHVTVARVAGRDPRVRPRTPPPPSSTAFSASRVVLYRSRLLAGGAEYEALAGVALEPG